MNNARYTATLEVEPTIDRTPYLSSRKKELHETITALRTVASSPEWKKLKRNIFDGVLESLQRLISKTNDDKEMYRLQGQIGWAQKYCDLDSLSKAFDVELTSINEQLKQYGQTEKD